MDRNEFLEICETVADLVTAKSEDYQGGSVAMSEYFKFGHISYVQMLRTKVLRLTSLTEQNKTPNFEGIADTVKDLVSYSVFYLDYLYNTEPEETAQAAVDLQSIRNRLSAAKNRCTNSKNPVWPYYGGRGIKYLITDVAEVINALGACPKGYLLDRIDNDGHYELKNLKWSSPLESTLNRGTRIPGKSGRTGVGSAGARGWVAYGISASGRREVLYQGRDLDLAIAAREAWENRNV